MAEEKVYVKIKDLNEAQRNDATKRIASLVYMQMEKDDINEAYKEQINDLVEAYNLDKKVVNDMVKALHKQNYADVSEKQDEVYESLSTINILNIAEGKESITTLIK